MSTHKHFNKICVVAVVLALIITVIFINGEVLGIEQAESVVQYENRLFDTSSVHTIDIVMSDWDGFIETCENEEYETCSVVIDGEAFKNVAIRAKGNTSLSMVSSSDSDRYSFKIEFDHYDSSNTYYGLDKLSLNNLIQDNTYMKDYIVYQTMREFGVAAPLCSFVNITVNGEAWGVYLAVEAIEDSFLKRNYGNDYGELYKPDSMSFGGGRGNGKEFDIETFFSTENATDSETTSNNVTESAEGGKFAGGGRGNRENMPSNGERSQIPQNGEKPFGETPQNNGDDRGMKGGMGSDDVKLKYIDDNISSYSNIFENAKTDVSDSDKERLIEALKNLSENKNINDTVSVDDVIRYFVVHNYVCNGDSYTGSMIHNYYLYEDSGKLSMLPWDYNLSFGAFQSSSATDTVNSPIDTPVSGGSNDDRPMIDWIFSSDEYTEKYHQYFSEFLETVNIDSLIEETYALIAPYVENDPSAFCNYEDFQKGVETLIKFCEKRSESIMGQLSGKIPSTTAGQNEDNSKLIDASEIVISDMGSMGHGGGSVGDGFIRPGHNSQPSSENTDSAESKEETTATENELPSEFNPKQGEQIPGAPDGAAPPEKPEGNMPAQMPEGDMPQGSPGMPMVGEGGGFKPFGETENT